MFPAQHSDLIKTLNLIVRSLGPLRGINAKLQILSVMLEQKMKLELEQTMKLDGLKTATTTAPPSPSPSPSPPPKPTGNNPTTDLRGRRLSTTTSTTTSTTQQDTNFKDLNRSLMRMAQANEDLVLQQKIANSYLKKITDFFGAVT